MTTKKTEEQKSRVRGLFAQEDETIKKKPNNPQVKKPVNKVNKKLSPKTEQTIETKSTEEKPKYLTTKKAGRGILHCEIGPELYERAALYAYDVQAPVKDMTDLTRKALAAYLDHGEPRLKKLKAYEAKLT